MKAQNSSKSRVSLLSTSAASNSIAFWRMATWNVSSSSSAVTAALSFARGRTNSEAMPLEGGRSDAFGLVARSRKAAMPSDDANLGERSRDMGHTAGGEPDLRYTTRPEPL